MGQVSQPKYVTGGRKVGKAELEDLPSSYDRKNFYIAATDSDGQATSVRWEVGRVPYYIRSRMAKWVDDERTPYTSVADFVRDCIRHRLHDLEDFAKDPEFDWGPFEHWAKIKELTLEIADLENRVTEARKLIEQAMARSDGVLLKQALTEVYALIRSTREPYRSQLQQLYDSYKSVALMGGER